MCFVLTFFSHFFFTRIYKYQTKKQRFSCHVFFCHIVLNFCFSYLEMIMLLCIQQKVLPVGLRKRKSRFYLIGHLNLLILIQLNTFVERRLKNRKKHPKNATELEIALKEEWSLIPHKTYSKLIESMPRRLEACISNNGWPTQY